VSACPLPACRHRGPFAHAGRWPCRHPQLIVPDGLVSAEYCSTCSCAEQPLGADSGSAQLPLASLLAAPRAAPSASDRSLAIAMITAPRPVRTVERSLAELRRGGFEQTVHLFEEPGTGAASGPDVVVRTNQRRRGMWSNWLQAAEFLLDATTANRLLVCEDDIQLCPAAAATLARGWRCFPPSEFGLASLYTPLHNLPAKGKLSRGWHGLILGRVNWGSLAYCFSRQSLRRILSFEVVRRHDTHKDTDSVIGAACVALGLRMYFHLPSLAAHTGAGCSTVDHIPLADSAPVDFDLEFGSLVADQSEGPLDAAPRLGIAVLNQ